MKTLLSHPTIPLLLIGCWLFCAGCGSTAPARFYMLSPVSESNRPADIDITRGRTFIGIGPVTLPLYLDRPQIVTTAGLSEMELGDFNKWAEPLKDNFSRVLSENLWAMLSNEPVALLPWQSSLPIDYRIEVEVIRFDGSLGENASLVAWWKVIDDRKKELLFARRSAISEPALAQTYEALVLAQSRAVTVFSREIADAVKRLIPKK